MIETQASPREENVRSLLRAPGKPFHPPLTDASGLGGADFLDEAVLVGKAWAREGPETGENAGRPNAAGSVSSSRKAVSRGPQRPS